jgi:uncharacterized membrane protein
LGWRPGGVGTSLADLFGGYAQFAWLSLIAHGLEGLVIGLLGRGRRTLPSMILAWLAGALVMVASYLAGEGLLLTGWPAALAELPMNALQALLGAVAGIPLVLAVRRAYPRVDQIGQRREWTE